MVVSQAATYFHGSLFSTFRSRRMEPSRMKTPFFALHFPTQRNRLQKASKIFGKVLSRLPLLAKGEINCCNILVFGTKYECPYILEDDDCEDDDDDDCEDDDDDDDECECDDDDDDDDDDCEDDDDDDDDDDDCEEEDEDDDDDDDCEEDDDDDDDDDDECECDG